MLADGGEAISDLAVLRDQAALFGPVASDPTAWRLLSGLDEPMLVGLRAARAAAREIAWAQHAETRGDLPTPQVVGQVVAGLILDMDASIVLCHSEKESATRTWKKTFGHHPLFCFLDNTGEALAGLLREGRAGSNTTADHITVLDQALAQIPDHQRHGTPILLRSDSAGSSHGFLAHIRALRGDGVDIRFSVGIAVTEPVREAIRAVTDWIPALDSDGDLREHPRNEIAVAEIRYAPHPKIRMIRPILPLMPGTPARWTHDYVRHGTTSLFAALDISSGSVIATHHRRHRHQEFLRFLKLIDSAVPKDLDLHLVLDNYATHKTPQVKAWLLKHPRFHLHFTPTSSSWLNLVERWFAELTNRKLRRSAHRSVTELETDVRRWINEWNAHPKPFVWTKTADAILETLAAYCTRINDSGH